MYVNGSIVNNGATPVALVKAGVNGTISTWTTPTPIPAAPSSTAGAAYNKAGARFT